MAKKMVILSIDAMGAADLQEKIEDCSTLKWIKENGVHVQEVEGIYPTLTYPSHTTIVTGVRPKKHGIVNNTKIQPKRMSPDWFWYRKDVLVDTLYDCAKREGKTVAAFLWPVTAKSKIDWNIAEIFPNRIWTNQVLISMSASSPLFIYEMNKKYGHLRRGIHQPELDDFVTACAVDTLKTKQPDLTLIHLVDMDSQRHAHGVTSAEAFDALKRQDKRVRDIVQATKEAGTFDDTTFVVLGDHYQIDVQYMIRLNVLFEKKGWLRKRKDGTIEKDWQVLAKSCDGSTYIYKNTASGIQPIEVQKALEEVEGIEAILNHWQLNQTGADSSALFMAEAKRGFYFQDEAIGEVVEKVDDSEIGTPNRYKAVHGFSPKKTNYATTLLLMGEGIEKGKVLDCASLVDEAPTFAEILGLETFPKEVDGRVLHEIFTDDGGRE